VFAAWLLADGAATKARTAGWAKVAGVDVLEAMALPTTLRKLTGCEPHEDVSVRGVEPEERAGIQRRPTGQPGCPGEPAGEEQDCPKQAGESTAPREEEPPHPRRLRLPG